MKARHIVAKYVKKTTRLIVAYVVTKKLFMNVKPLHANIVIKDLLRHIFSKRIFPMYMKDEKILVAIHVEKVLDTQKPYKGNFRSFTKD